MFEVGLATHALFGPGCFARLGDEARGLGFRRVLLVADAGLVAAGHVDAAVRLLEAAGVAVVGFHGFSPDPDGTDVQAGASAARAASVDSLVALGGGSSLDCAKGLNLLLAGGGTIAEYRGFGLARGRLRPMIGVPTTAGTGSEAQSYALVRDPTTHAKLACGDAGLRFRRVLLDPELLASLPRGVAATAGYDALAHAVETWVTTRRTPFSDLFAREAFRLLEGAYEASLSGASSVDTRGDMLLGAHYAGAAIEASMLGAAHACANPLSARHGTPHGVAVALMLPSVVRFNAPVAGARYAELLSVAGREPGAEPAVTLAHRLEQLARVGGLPRSLPEAGIGVTDLEALSADAAGQWTGGFNPRPFDAAAARELYRCVL